MAKSQKDNNKITMSKSRSGAGFEANPQNINRKGAPKKEWTMTGLIKASLEESNEKGVPYKVVIINKLRELAMRGDMQAIKEITNRLDGMPTQKTDLTTNGKDLPTPIIPIKNVILSNNSDPKDL